ncbi:MAG: bifunctional D-glycero-beta-D-manno-heptose-7-phosphate kinase/D-glycero-beta-D-manno-heptose 1-phosphate adenylyltransferase HldE [Proteobacteria bacterium]|nr:bifunctional D-glycero-beta-D-manno-heptose-7-phosphate kinase/D-glycero-beta-D-manno-heptose 1-phosphate adenylyltransferase HldE [Pseudomonadota bacterium]
MNLNIPAFQSAHILIIGDIMLDRYLHGVTSRISPEAPVPVVHVKHQQECPGGAGNVAFNIRALDGQVTVIGVIGQDEAANIIKTQLTKKGINCAFIQLDNVSTVTKLRVVSRQQQLIRLDFEDGFIELDSQDIKQQMLSCLQNIDTIILSDYGKGTLANPQTLINIARNANKPIFVDPKGDDFNKYRGATIITPNLSEFEAVVGSCIDQNQLVEKGNNLLKQLDLEALLITRSQDGMTLIRDKQPPLHLPAHSHEVYDVTGAGDTVISVLATARASGQDWNSATALANLAAGLVVTKLGTTTITVAELEHALHTETRIHDSTSLKMAVMTAQNNGETVVMTNGCFDILHAGHIQYLTQAKQLGDRLIVAINDDDSVRSLKGNKRPVNSLEQRMTVLNALECVDWVIPFGEDTPKNLICNILPNILVKGSDYQIAQIAGSDCVLAQGGQVLTLDFLAGCSTSNIIRTLQEKL